MFIHILPGIQKPDEEHFGIVDPEKGPMLVNGPGDHDLACGRCGAVLAEQLEWEQAKGFVVRCYRCRTYSWIPVSWPVTWAWQN